MQLRAFPLVVGAAAGALDGVLQDADAAAGRVTNTKQWSTYFEAAAVVGGYLAENLGFSREVSEPLVYGGLFKLSSRAGRFVSGEQKLFWGTKTPTAPAPLMAARAAALNRVGAAAYLASQPGRELQPAGVLV